MATTLISTLGADLAKEIIGIGLSTIPEQLSAAVTATKRHDFAELARLAHQMSGGAGALGLAKLADSCRRVEDSAREGNETEIPALVNALEAQTKTALSDLSLLLASID